MVLMGRGIACEIAANGQEAIDIITSKGDDIDCIFMDHFMPVMVRTNYATSLLCNTMISSTAILIYYIVDGANYSFDNCRCSLIIQLLFNATALRLELMRLEVSGWEDLSD